MVFPGPKKVIFIHGCFWHGHHCRFETAKAKSNVDFWHDKIRANINRDTRTKRRLRAMGWRSAVVWECQVKKENWLPRILRFLAT